MTTYSQPQVFSAVVWRIAHSFSTAMTRRRALHWAATAARSAVGHLWL